MLKCFARGSYALEQEVELDKNIDYRCHQRKCTYVNVHSRLPSVMLVCKNAIVTFWNALWSKNNKQINFITVLFFNTAPLHFMENKAHFVPLIHPPKVQYLVVIPWARVVCLIYTPEARGLRVYISGKPQVHMV